AQSDGQGAGAGYFLRQLTGFLRQRLGRDDQVHQSPVGSGRGVDHLSREEHLQGAFTADGAAERYHRRGAEQSNLDSGCGKPHFVGSDGQIAGGHQLAARRGCGSLHLGNHRLRNGLDLHHQVGANIEDLPVIIDVLARHFGQIVARAKDVSRGCQDDGMNFAIAANGGKAVDQLAHEIERERVAPVRTVERDHRQISLAFEFQVLVGGDGLQSRCCHGYLLVAVRGFYTWEWGLGRTSTGDRTVRLPSAGERAQIKKDTAHAVSLPTSNLSYLLSLGSPAPNSLRWITGRAALADAAAGIAAAAP